MFSQDSGEEYSTQQISTPHLFRTKSLTGFYSEVRKVSVSLHYKGRFCYFSESYIILPTHLVLNLSCFLIPTTIIRLSLKSLRIFWDWTNHISPLLLLFIVVMLGTSLESVTVSPDWLFANIIHISRLLLSFLINYYASL